MDFETRQFKNGIMILGDCQEVLKTLDKNSVEVCVTSPPYNLCKRYTNYNSTKTSKSMSEKFEKWYDDELSEWEYQGQQQSVIHSLMRVCKSSIFYNHKVRFAWHNRNIFRTESNIHHPMHWLDKFPIWCEIIWDRCGIGNPTRRYHSQDERIYQIGKPKKWDNSELKLTNIWKFPPSKNKGHVCTFPEKLVENCIFPTTESGDVVLDPYMGSGTTAIVAINNGRRFIGIESNREYFELACSRIQKLEDELESQIGVEYEE
jgi:site-specific DNA-methyltransferase (adenine-specific)